MQLNELSYSKTFRALFQKDSAARAASSIILISSLYLLRYNDFQMFHIAVEIFSAVVSFGIFMFSMNSYSISSNDYFKFIGVGYLFVGMLDIFHVFSYESMQIFPNASQDMVSRFWLAARTFEVATVLLSNLFLTGKIRRPRYPLIHFLFLFFFVIVFAEAVYLNLLPSSWDSGQTRFKLFSEYIITLGFTAGVVMCYRSRHLMDRELFYYMMISLALKVVYEVCIFKFINNRDMMFAVGHIVKVISFLFMYRGILVTGIKRPYDKLVNNLDEEESFRRNMEEAIHLSDKCYDILINRSGDGIIIHTRDTIIFANDTAAKTIGVGAAADIIGKKIWDVVHYECSEQIMDRFMKVREEKTSLPFMNVKLISPEGLSIEGEQCCNYIMYRGQPAILTILRGFSYQEKINLLKKDIAASEKKLEKSNEYNMLLTEFFTNISHELKTPLNIILGSIQLLELPCSDKLSYEYEEKHSRYLKIMKQNSYRLIRLINNLIDISKYDTNYLKLDRRNCDMVSIVEDIVLSVVDSFRSKGVNVIFDTDTEEKIMAVDEDKIERIILNLLSNAVKFTNDGGQIFVNFEDHEDFVRIMFKDTGIGIPEDKLDIIFDRFGQVDRSMTRNREGSGIGLSLVKAIVQMHGGTVSVKSTVGVGSEFTVELPAVLAEEEYNTEAIAITCDSNMDKIDIEFSDIYSVD
ncbi:MAG: MASE3 domain-containing protein [Sedimentibacter sp.]|uniref:MASE3 domain-containing sensor histidine kinase n=1 Tax=Sedimentibacter sp. TaxID=1960295 RepID=UPI0031581019